MTPSGTPAPRPRVLFVLGCGRSGSTVLTSLLGSSPQVFGAGELSNLIDHGWIQGLYCACGVTVPRCFFWSRVHHLWGRDAKTFLRSQRFNERLVGWLWTLLRSGVRRTDSSIYAEATRDLFSTIVQVAGRPIIVDASKSPLRAAALARNPGLDLRLIHLVRDGRGVALSLSRGTRKSPKDGVQKDLPSHPIARTARRWKWANRMCDLVRRSLPPDRSMLLRYEDLVDAPGPSLRRIGVLLGLDLSPVVEAVERGDTFGAGHNVAGNRVRMQGPVRLLRDEDWKKELRDSERWRFERIAGSVLRSYAYRIPPRSGPRG